MTERMKLHWSPRSPFVRKVMIVLSETGLTDRVDLVRSVVAMHLPPNPDVLADNPLAKIPTLVTAEGQSLFDSRVICEYLDMQAGTGLFPEDPQARVAQLRWQALGDGLTDILLIWRTELTRETGPWQAVTEGWQVKVRAAMAKLEAEVPGAAGGALRHRAGGADLRVGPAGFPLARLQVARPFPGAGRMGGRHGPAPLCGRTPGGRRPRGRRRHHRRPARVLRKPAGAVRGPGLHAKI